jgi:serine/threonine protein kinase
MHSQEPPIYHRDIKEENIIMINDTVKILDFGRYSFIHKNSATTKVINYETTKIKDYVNEEVDYFMNTSRPFRSPEIIDFYNDGRIIN